MRGYIDPMTFNPIGYDYPAPMDVPLAVPTLPIGQPTGCQVVKGPGTAVSVPAGCPITSTTDVATMPPEAFMPYSPTPTPEVQVLLPNGAAVVPAVQPQSSGFPWGWVLGLGAAIGLGWLVFGGGGRAKNPAAREKLPKFKVGDSVREVDFHGTWKVVRIGDFDSYADTRRYQIKPSSKLARETAPWRVVWVFEKNMRGV